MTNEKIQALRKQIALKNQDHPDSTVWLVVGELLDEIERHRPPRRPCEVIYRLGGDVWTSDSKAFFLGFGIENNETIAIVELSEGAIITVSPHNKLRFLDV